MSQLLDPWRRTRHALIFAALALKANVGVSSADACNSSGVGLGLCFVSDSMLQTRSGVLQRGSIAITEQAEEGRAGATLSVALKRRRVSVLSGTRRSDRELQRGGVVHKTAYSGSLAVGNPAQTFSVVFDTGSGNLMLPADDCDSEACTAHNRFMHAKSLTSRRVSCDGSPSRSNFDEVMITFGTGEIWGHCIRDSICLGSTCVHGSFIAATYESENPFKSFAFDGVLGLALPMMSQGSDFNLMGQLGERRALRESLFSVFLSDASSEQSEVTFGEVKQEHLASDLFWVPVWRDSGYWEIHIDDVSLDDKAQELCVSCAVAVDTGTSELAGPSDVIQALGERLDVREDCSNYRELPRLGFIVGERILNLEPRDYVDKAGNACSVAFMSLDVPPPKGPLFVFGIPFLQKFVTVYDTANRRIGFGVARHVDTEVTQAPPSVLLAQYPREMAKDGDGLDNKARSSQ